MTTTWTPVGPPPSWDGPYTWDSGTASWDAPMTTWTAQGVGSVTWTLAPGPASGSTWDGGASLWDAGASTWDGASWTIPVVTAATWTLNTTTPVVWTKAS